MYIFIKKFTSHICKRYIPYNKCIIKQTNVTTIANTQTLSYLGKYEIVSDTSNNMVIHVKSDVNNNPISKKFII